MIIINKKTKTKTVKVLLYKPTKLMLSLAIDSVIKPLVSVYLYMKLVEIFVAPIRKNTKDLS